MVACTNLVFPRSIGLDKVVVDTMEASVVEG